MQEINWFQVIGTIIAILGALLPPYISLTNKMASLEATTSAQGREIGELKDEQKEIKQTQASKLDQILQTLTHLEVQIARLQGINQGKDTPK